MSKTPYEMIHYSVCQLLMNAVLMSQTNLTQLFAHTTVQPTLMGNKIMRHSRFQAGELKGNNQKHIETSTILEILDEDKRN